MISKRRRSRKTVEQRIATSLHILEKLRAAEWMVSCDWAPQAERHPILEAVDEVLSSDWAKRYLKGQS